jgi:hypothetical protein
MLLQHGTFSVSSSRSTATSAGHGVREARFGVDTGAPCATQIRSPVFSRIFTLTAERPWPCLRRVDRIVCRCRQKMRRPRATSSNGSVHDLAGREFVDAQAEGLAIKRRAAIPPTVPVPTLMGRSA